MFEIKVYKIKVCNTTSFDNIPAIKLAKQTLEISLSFLND